MLGQCFHEHIIKQTLPDPLKYFLCFYAIKGIYCVVRIEPFDFNVRLTMEMEIRIDWILDCNSCNCVVIYGAVSDCAVYCNSA